VVKNWLNVREVAAQLGVAPTTIYALCQEGRLPHARLGIGRGTIRVAASDLAAFMEKCMTTAPSGKNAADLDQPNAS
jgi:excisionase family DNA binding protein